MKKCVNCGRISEINNLTTCSACGGMLVETNGIFCPKCGTQIAGGWAVCPVCAAPLSGGTPAPKKKTGMIVLVAVLVIALIGAIVGLSIYLNSQDTGSGSSGSSSGSSGEKAPSNDEEAAEDVAEKFMYAYSCKQIEKFSDKFYNCEPYVLEGSEMYERIDHFRDIDNDEGDIEIHNVGAKRSEFKIVDVEIDGDKAVVKVELTCVDEGDMRERYRVDYEWLFEAWLAYPNGIYDPDELTPAQEVEMEEKFEEEYKEELQKYYLHAAEDADLATGEGELLMEKHDGKWYVADTE